MSVGDPRLPGAVALVAVQAVARTSPTDRCYSKPAHASSASGTRLRFQQELAPAGLTRLRHLCCECLLQAWLWQPNTSVATEAVDKQIPGKYTGTQSHGKSEHDQCEVACAETTQHSAQLRCLIVAALARVALL